MHRLVRPDHAHTALHDRLVAHLRQRLERSPDGLIATYPGEVYPPDVAACLGAVGLHGRATGVDPGLDAVLHRFAGAIDPVTGLLRQHRHGPPRASGTAIASYFLTFASPELAGRLAAALRDQHSGVLGFGGVLEYPPGVAGHGDVDSGPLVLGMSPAASGFALAAARISGDRHAFVRLHRSAQAVGWPVRWGDGRHFVVGGRLADAILLAMVTTPAARTVE